eukprot:scaffold179822_cov31-Tisochrysis_lutea.AAC.11
MQDESAIVANTVNASFTIPRSHSKEGGAATTAAWVTSLAVTPGHGGRCICRRLKLIVVLRAITARGFFSAATFPGEGAGPQECRATRRAKRQDLWI